MTICSHVAHTFFRAWDLDEVRQRVTQQMETCTASAIDGSTCELPVKDHPISICCHSDVPGCLELVKATRVAVNTFNKTHFPEK